jgi:hypothetical protein
MTRLEAKIEKVIAKAVSSRERRKYLKTAIMKIIKEEEDKK